MKAKHRTKRIQRYRKMLGIIVLMLTITLIGVVVSATVLYKRKNACKTPDTILVEYMMHIPKQEYEEMYAMIDLESSGYISKEDFLKRNSTIYEGIEMQNMSIKNVEYVEEDKKVTYLTSFDTVAGTISFENEAFFINGEEGYKLVWDDCMYEDVYRISTGENLKTEGWKIPAEEYERIMTTYFPVSVEQLREHCGYDEGSNSYEYEMIYASPYPPFGEVVDYTQNTDGTITLIVDGVWPDYNSDLAFRNTVVVQPFEDGTFRYLSNSIEQIELELPPIAKAH